MVRERESGRGKTGSLRLRAGARVRGAARREALP